jgi:hypothetical protein
MLQMAAVFAELERGMIRERAMEELAWVRGEGKKTLGRPKVGKKVEDAIRVRLTAGDGMFEGIQVPWRGSFDCHADAGSYASAARHGVVARQMVCAPLTAAAQTSPHIGHSQEKTISIKICHLYTRRAQPNMV